MPVRERVSVGYECAAASARGIIRRLNQDRFRISGAGIVLCDGVGGAEAGEVFAEASCWGCDRLLGTDLAADEIIDDANRRVTMLRDALNVSGGSSVCVARFNGDGSVDIGSRGDVLALRLSDDGVSVINSPDYAGGDALARYLGDGAERGRPSQLHCALPLETPDECLVFATDGVWKSLSQGDLARLWRDAGRDAGRMAEGLVALAGRYGSLDDRTAVVCTCAA